MSELILPSVNFSGLRDGLILRTPLQKKNSQKYVVLHTKMSCTLFFYILGIYFLAGA